MGNNKQFRPRDENGWRIPREGSVARQIYDLLKQGKSRAEIREALPQLGRRRIDSKISVIRNPDWANKLRAASGRRERAASAAPVEHPQMPEPVSPPSAPSVLVQQNANYAPLRPEIKTAIIEYIASLNLAKPQCIADLDDAMLKIVRLRQVAAAIHGNLKIPPWRLTESGVERLAHMERFDRVR